jgi:hypothetical protein
VEPSPTFSCTADILEVVRDRCTSSGVPRHCAVCRKAPSGMRLLLLLLEEISTPVRMSCAMRLKKTTTTCDGN